MAYAQSPVWINAETLSEVDRASILRAVRTAGLRDWSGASVDYAHVRTAVLALRNRTFRSGLRQSLPRLDANTISGVFQSCAA